VDYAIAMLLCRIVDLEGFAVISTNPEPLPIRRRVSEQSSPQYQTS
jgi:hypothetical protein